jgi:hypothetical protein
MSLSQIALTSQGPMVGDYISTSFSGGRWLRRLQDAVCPLGEEAEANGAELERRAIAYDDPGCPPDSFGPNEPGTSGR